MSNIQAIVAQLSNPLFKGYHPTPVGDHSFINLSVKEWCELNPISVNRDSKARVPKMKEVFDKAHDLGYTSTLTEVALGVVESDFTDDVGNEFKRGEWYRLDGNTRAHYWILYPEKINKIKTGLTAKIHLLNSFQDIEFAYYPYNNKQSVEKSTDLLQGQARKYNWVPKQKMFAGGQYGTAIDWATRGGPSDDKPDLFRAFAICFEGLKFIDSIPKGEGPTISKPELKGIAKQSVYAALLATYRLRGPNLNLISLIERLAKITKEEVWKALSNDKLSAIEIIAAEYEGLIPEKDRWIAGNCAGDTKFATATPQMDFLLYWIDQYVENPAVHFKKSEVSRNVKGGGKKWEGFWEEFFTEQE